MQRATIEDGHGEAMSGIIHCHVHGCGAGPKEMSCSQVIRLDLEPKC